MTSRVLSAYFDDFRKGKRQREELRLFMEDAIRREPLRRGHFMGWLDQAQYEHPIPVTEFLLLRKEIEASLDNDDQTRIVPPPGPVKASPDAETLVAGNEEETLVAPGQEDDDSTEISMGSQPSDMARLHAAATMIASPREEAAVQEEVAEQDEATIISTSHASVAETQQQAPVAHQRPAPPTHRKQDKPATQPALPIWVWLSAGILMVAAGIGYWAMRPVTNVIVVEPTPPPEQSQATDSVEALAKELIDSPDQTSPATTPDVVTTPTPAPPEPSPQAEADTAQAQVAALAEGLSPQQAIATLLQRVSDEKLLPLDQIGNAQEVMDYMQSHYPNAPEVLEARQVLKDAYLSASKRAQGQGEWDRSQELLDAAFNVLNATAR